MVGTVWDRVLRASGGFGNSSSNRGSAVASGSAGGAGGAAGGGGGGMRCAVGTSLACHRRRQHQHQRLNHPRRQLHSTMRASRRTALRVEANELNKWANKDGPDSNAGPGEGLHDRETTETVMRVLTARATQRVHIQLHATNPASAEWLNMFCKANPPLEGEEFLKKLLHQRPVLGRDGAPPALGVGHSPGQMAARILAVREDMAAQVAARLAGEMTRSNIKVLRHHLEHHTYTSGTHTPGNNAAKKRDTLPRWLQNRGAT